MNPIDLTPLYRNSIGFDRFASILDNVLSADAVATTYPPYNIEVLEENRYAITLAVAGFSESEIDITVEKNVLKVSGQKAKEDKVHNYLHQGIASRSFERKFNLADYVEVTSANLVNGLLAIELARKIPEAMKPKKIAITQANKVLEHQGSGQTKQSDQKAA